MKWLFILLVMVNIALYAWGVQREQQRSVEPARLLPNVGSLLLTSEMGNTQPADSSDENPPTAAPADTFAEEVAPVSSIAPEVDSGVEEAHFQATSNLAEKVESVQSEAVPLEGQQLAEAEQGPSQQPDAPLPQDDGQEPEQPDAPLPQDDGQDTEEPQAAPVCGAFGGFDRGALARDVMGQLEQQQIVVELRKESVRKPIGYWVLIPPMKSTEEAVILVERLRESGVSDIRRFVRGEQRNGISLGVFSSRQNAENRRKQVAREGISIEIAPRFITAPIYWIDYRGQEAALDQAYSRLKAEFKELERKPAPC